MCKALLQRGVVSSRLFLDLLVLVVYQQKLQMSMQLKNDNMLSSVRPPVLSISWDGVTAVLLHVFALHFHEHTPGQTISSCTPDLIYRLAYKINTSVARNAHEKSMTSWR